MGAGRGRIARVIIHLSEGPRTTITDVHITGAPTDKRLNLTKDIVVQKKNALKIADIDQDIQTITGKLGDRGYLEASVNYQLDFSPDSLGVSVEYAIRAGPHIRVGAVQIIGLQAVKDKVVRREFRVKEKGVLTNTALSCSASIRLRRAIL